ncbi:MAG: TonB-dependent receptor [Saprospiraceae bacterium]|nr:TonB-dependent receptor [Saprospiraceae bacterium]
MTRLFVLLVFTALSFAAVAQGRLISGKVTDAGGIGLPGVTVQVVGTSTGTVTDFDGTYQLSADEGTLRFSYVGFASQDVAIAGRSTIDVILLEEAQLLEQVVVIGYGTQKKKDLSTAVVTIDEDAIKERPLVSAAEALQGKAAGVQVVQPSGKPGADLSVRVRGSTSVLAGNEPLYVVDGVPTTDIRGLNPTDIATMTVLKDASSAAIYGARAANGVVLITTKRGKENTPVIRLDAYAGISRLRKTVEVLTTKGYRDLMDEIIPGALDPSQTDFNDWSKEVFGTGKNQSYQLSYSGGNDKSRYFLSAGYLNNEGIVRPARFDRYSFRLNLDNDLKPWLKIGASINALHSKTKDTPDNASSGRGGVIMSALNTPPFLNIYNEDGSGQFDPNPFQPSWENPVAYMEGPKQQALDNRLFGNVTAEVKLLEGLAFKTNVGIDLNAHQWDYYLDPFRTTFGRSQNGIGRADKSNTSTWLWENTLNYVKSIGRSNFSVLAGSSLQKQRWNDSYIEGNDFPDNVSVTTLNAANNITASTNIQEWSLASFFGRATYDFNNKYYLTASLRRDGSSKLAQHWGTMPSFSVAWRLSAEPFMQNLSFIDDLKLRGGWGKNGNQEGISNYARYGLISYYRRTSTNPLSGPAAVQVSYGNPDLRWETTSQSNIGIDLSILNYRVNFTVDAYIKKTDDVLLDVQLSNSLPITTIQTNAGQIENKGIEFNISTVNMDRKLRWNTDFNISFNKNKVISLDYTDVYYFGRIYSNNQDVAIVREGLSLGSFFGYVSDGVDPETGDLKYRDVNGNGVFDTGDRTVIGNAQPDFVFGLTNSFTYKRFDFNFFFQGSYGNDIYNATRIDLEGMFDSKNQSVAVLRRWTPDNRDTDIPRAVGGGNVDNVRNSTRFVEDGSYVRLKAVTLLYRLVERKQRPTGLQQVSVYATGQNLLTFTKYSGFDPEVNAFGRSATELGIDYGTYPQAITVTVGFNVEF